MSPRPSLLPLVVAAWIGACGLGMWQLLAHAATPGAVEALPERLPAPVVTALQWPGERALLVVAAHPQCPCLPSTFDALSQALAGNPDLDLRVLVYRPSAPSATWDARAFTTLAEGLPAGTAVVDRDGMLARALGAEASGHVALYDRTGRLTFAGGITTGRDDAAARVLRRVLADPTRAAAPVRTAVFGCPLTPDADAPRDDCRQPHATR